MNPRMKYLMRGLIMLWVLLFLLATLERTPQAKEAPAAGNSERLTHCNMLWGGSAHFHTCMRGARVIPSSGR